MSTSLSDLARRYWVTDMPSAQLAGTRLSNALKAIAQKQPLKGAEKSYLLTQGLHALVELACSSLPEGQFNQRARAESEQRAAARVQRQQEAEAERAAAAAREATMWARLEAERVKRESDPKFIARRKNQELRYKYGVACFVEQEHFARLMGILRKLEAKSRLPELDSVWLTTKGRAYHSEEIRHAHHRLEADFCLAEYKRTNDPWQAVNASGHLRKCKAAKEAHELLVSIPEARLKQTKLKSAVRTTHGGALRDLGRYSEALKYGEEAHALLPENFRPCTLQGAIHMEMGNIREGHEWYRKAEERGATSDSIESELRSVLARMSAEKRKEAVAELLRIDPKGYGWLRKQQTDKARRRG